MFQALQNVYKKDARYRKLVIGQRVAMLGLVAGMGLSIIAIGYGIHTMKLEKVNRYNEIVKQQTEYRKSGEYEKEEAQYQKAINLLHNMRSKCRQLKTPDGMASAYCFVLCHVFCLVVFGMVMILCVVL